MYSFGLPQRLPVAYFFEALLKYPNIRHLCPHPWFYQLKHFSGKVITCPAHDAAPLIIPDSQTVVAPCFKHIHTLHPFLLSRILPCPHLPLFCNSTPTQTASPGVSWELGSTNFCLNRRPGLTTPLRSTPQIDEPSDADLLYMAATLEPPHIWSGVRSLKSRSQPWPKQV